MKNLLLIGFLFFASIVSNAQGEDLFEDEEILFSQADTLFSPEERVEGQEMVVEANGNIGYCDQGNYIVFNSVDFETAATYEFTINRSHKLAEGTVMGSFWMYINDEFIDSLVITATGGWGTYVDTIYEVEIPVVAENASLKFLANVTHESNPHLANLMYFMYVVIPGTEIETSSIDLTNQTDIKVYPNPVQNSLNIKSNNLIQSAQIINQTGQIVISSNINATHGIVNLDQLPSGLYTVKVTDEQQTEIRRIIKK